MNRKNKSLNEYTLAGNKKSINISIRNRREKQNLNLYNDVVPLEELNAFGNTDVTPLMVITPPLAFQPPHGFKRLSIKGNDYIIVITILYMFHQYVHLFM